MSKADWFTDDFAYLGHNDMVVEVYSDDLEETIKLPLSKIEFEETLQYLEEGQVFQISMPEWLATDRGLT